MTLERVSEFVTFLSNKDHSLSRILAHLARVTFRDLNCASIVLFELNDRNEYHTVEISGVSAESADELSEKYSLRENYPVADAIRHQKINLITPCEMFEKYPLLANYPEMLTGNSIFAVPISLSGTPVAAFSIICEGDASLLDIELDFLVAISDIFALSVYALRDFSSVDRKVEKDIPHLKANDSEGLTPRQILISRLVSEGRTNHDISELIGYSESTVRQEIMKLFVLTNSASRREVGKHYRSTH